MPRIVLSCASFALFIALLMPASGAFAAAVPTAHDKDNYERILAIVMTGSKENKAAAQESLKNMGEVGIALLKADCEKIDSPRGTLAWSLLKEVLPDTQREVLLEFARKNLVDAARDWNQTYVPAKADKARQQRLREVVTDYVYLLAVSDKPKDFECLLKALKYSLVVEAKVEFAAEYEVWGRIWTLLNEKIKVADSAKDLESWQAIVDGHFRTYSLQKGYVDRKAIQSYHTTTLLFMARLDALHALHAK